MGETEPYFHDGQAATLHDVIEHYDRGGGRADGNPALGPLDRDIRPLLLTQEEIDDLADFLEALTASPN